MEVVFAPVRSHEECVQLASLADEIWHEYWPPRIGIAQTDYMVKRFQSLPVLERDLDSGTYQYWFLQAKDTGRILGYTGARIEQETNRLFISKIYLLAKERGHGLGSQTIRFYERLASAQKLDALYLTVNKHNDLAIRSYKKNGFQIIDAVETDIGEGFVMDDFIMELKVL